jgi:hypothetical protein
MLISLSVDWWEEATHEEQLAYLKEHPSSKKKLTKKVAPKKETAKKTSKPVQKKPSSQRKPTVNMERIRTLGLGPNPTKKQLAALNELDLKTVGTAKLIKLADHYRYDDHSAWTEKAFDKWYGDLTDDEAESFAQYTYRLDGEVNHYLRTGIKRPPRANEDAYKNDDDYIDYTLSDVQEHIKKLDAGLKKSKLDKDVTVFRGLNLSDKSGRLIQGLKGLLGKGLTEKGFMSTSSSPSTAISFMGGRSSKADRTVVVAIALKKGSKVGSIGEGIARKINMAYPDVVMECEILLPRNSTIVPTKIEEMESQDQPPRYIIHAEVVFPKQ